jgi:glycosyltransferase involved in cell wall biosynthesis
LRILINFSTLKKGGGQNVAMNFLLQLDKIDFEDIKFFFVVAEGSEIHNFLSNKRNKYKFFIVSTNPIKRILFEIFKSKKLLIKYKIDIIYSYFGIGLYPRIVPQISGSADSNLYFPEVNFWSNYKGIQRLKKWIIDKYRIYGLKRATAIIFENESMRLRSQYLFNLKETKFIKPSINFDFSSKTINFNELNTTITKGLFLCSWQLNKNIMKIPEIANHLKLMGKKFLFIITAPKDNSKEYKKFNELIDKYDVNNMISIIGPIEKKYLASLYDKIDYVFLLSKLESFSNNIIESWYFQKPLIVSDEIWAHSICKNAACYVNRESAIDIAKMIIKLENDNKFKSQIIDNGNIEIKNYPTIQERIMEEMEYIKYVLQNY